MSDPTIVALLGLAGVALTAYFGNLIAKRKSKDDKSTSGFTQSFELSKYIREQVNEEVKAQTKEIRDELYKVKSILGSLYDKYDIVRGAFRIFYMATHKRLGEETPHLDPRIRRMLDESEEDSHTSEMMEDLRASIQREDESPRDSPKAETY